MQYALGTDLHPDDRTHVLATYVHRYTLERIPQWARRPAPSGKWYKPHHASDRDWLASTRFAVRKNGRLDHRERHCVGTPSWPHGAGYADEPYAWQHP